MQRYAQRAGSFYDVIGVQFDTDIAPTEAAGDEAHSSGPEKGIEDKIVRLGGRKNARLDQRFGKGRDVGTAGIRGIDAPDRSTIPLTAVLGAFLHGFVVVGVLFAFGEHEEVFVRSSGPIFHAFRHRVRLVPDDVAAEEPAVVLQRESEAPRDAEQIFVLETRWIVGAHVHGAVGIFLVGRSPPAVPAGVAVPDV